MTDQTDQQIPTEDKGYVLETFIDTFSTLQAILRNLILVKQLRCNSPLRSEICDEPAIKLAYLDHMNYYGCCEKHLVPNDRQWTGQERFSAHPIEVPIFNHDHPEIKDMIGNRAFRITEYRLHRGKPLP